MREVRLIAQSDVATADDADALRIVLRARDGNDDLLATVEVDIEGQHVAALLSPEDDADFSRVDAARPVLHTLGVPHAEEAVRRALQSNPTRSVPSRLRVTLASNEIAAFKKSALKMCEHQSREEIGLVCRVGAVDLTTKAAVDLDRPIRLEGRRHVLPTTLPICNACSMPDSRTVCSHLRWPEVRAVKKPQLGWSRKVVAAACELGKEPVTKRPGACRVGGAPCWERKLVIAGPAPDAAILSSAIVPDGFQPRPDPARPGVAGPRYRVDNEVLLGGGAFGKVRRGFDLRLNRVVAIKFIGPSVPSRDGAEAHVRAMVQVPTHPNIVDVFDLEELLDPDTGRASLAIVMAYVDGHSLGKGGALSADQARAAGLGLVAAIAHYHGHGAAHGDLHDGNVLMVGGQPMIIDAACVSTATAASLPKLAQRQQDDVRRVGYLLVQLARYASMDAGNAVDRVLMSSTVTLDVLRQAFDAAVGGSVARSPESRESARLVFSNGTAEAQHGVPPWVSPTEQDIKNALGLERLSTRNAIDDRRPSRYGIGDLDDVSGEVPHHLAVYEDHLRALPRHIERVRACVPIYLQLVNADTKPLDDVEVLVDCPSTVKNVHTKKSWPYVSSSPMRPMKIPGVALRPNWKQDGPRWQDVPGAVSMSWPPREHDGGLRAQFHLDRLKHGLTASLEPLCIEFASDVPLPDVIEIKTRIIVASPLVDLDAVLKIRVVRSMGA